MGSRGTAVRSFKLAMGASLLLSGVAFATDDWRLEGHGDRDVLVHVTDIGKKVILQLGDVVSFGRDHGRIALLSLDDRKSTELLIFEKGYKKVVKRWPVAARPVSQLAGATEDIVLRPEIAFFAIVRFAADQNSIRRNDLGGAFDLASVTLSDGRLDTWPLPKELTNPRLVQADGVVYVMNGERGAVWSFDEGSHVLVPVDTAQVTQLRLRPSPQPPLNSDAVVVIDHAN
jgi:hypothetical protein